MHAVYGCDQVLVHQQVRTISYKPLVTPRDGFLPQYQKRFVLWLIVCPIRHRCVEDGNPLACVGGPVPPAVNMLAIELLDEHCGVQEHWKARGLMSPATLSIQGTYHGASTPLKASTMPAR